MVALSLLGAVDRSQADILLAAPTALARCVNALSESWKLQTGGDISIAFGNSDDQSIEIETAARAYDVILLGDPHALHRLISKGLTQPAQPLGSSPIILAARRDHNEGEIRLTPQFHDRLAIHDPDVDGIGIVSRELLSQLGLWEGGADWLRPMASAAAMIRAIESGDVRYALILRADLKRAPALREVGRPDSEDYLYSALAVRRRFRPEIARFLTFLGSPTAAEIVRSQGYTAASDSDPGHI